MVQGRGHIHPPKERVYVAGPIHSPVGIDKEILKARFYTFVAWAKKWRPHWEVVNPLDCAPGCERPGAPPCQDRSGLPAGEGHSWECWMKGDLIHMLSCDSLALLPHWEASNGASLEADIAKKVHMTPYFAEPVHVEVNADGALGWTVL